MEILFIRFLLFVLPLIVLPFGTFHFETPKVILTELCIQVLLYVSLWNKRFQIKKVLDYWPLAGIFIVTIIQLVIGVNSSGLFGNPFRMQGMFFLWNMLVFSVMVSGFKPVRIPVTLIGIGLLVTIVAKTMYSFSKGHMIVETATFLGVLASLWFNPGSVYGLIIFWYLVGVGIRNWKSFQELPIE